MCHTSWLRRVLRWTLMAGFVVLLSSGLVMPQTSQSALAAACFAVADNVVCMDEPAIVSMPPIMPPLVGPTLAGGEGSDESVVIEDNGGYEQDNG